MRHKVHGRKFDRNSGARKALFRNLVTQLFEHDRIVTTQAKAKEVRSIAEKLITKAKREDVHSRRQVLRFVTNKKVVNRLFDTIIIKLSEKNQGGYTRILKLENRKGDDAPMALLEIIEPGEKHAKHKKAGKKKTKSKAKSDKRSVKDQKKTEKTDKQVVKEPVLKKEATKGETPEVVIETKETTTQTGISDSGKQNEETEDIPQETDNVNESAESLNTSDVKADEDIGQEEKVDDPREEKKEK